MDQTRVPQGLVAVIQFRLSETAGVERSTSAVFFSLRECDREDVLVRHLEDIPRFF